MSVSGKKRYAVIIAVSLLLAAAAALSYIPLGKYRQERAVLALIDRLPGTLQAGSASVDLLGNSVELENLSGTVEMFEGLSFELRVRKLRLEGINRDVGQSSGVVKVAERIIADHLSFTPDAELGGIIGYSSATVNTHTVDGLWLDWSLLQEATKAGPRSKAFADMLLSLRLGPTMVRDASVQVRDNPRPGAFDAGEYIIGVSRLEAESYSLHGTGKSKSWDYSQIYADGARFTVREMSFSSRSAPSGAFRMSVAGLFHKKGLSREDSLDLLKEGYSLRDLECRDLLLVSAEGKKLEIPSLSGDVDIGSGNFLLHFNVPDIWISGGLVAEALSDLDGRLAFLANRRLHLSTLVDWKIQAVSENAVKISCHQELHEAQLGSMVLNVNFSGSPATGEERVLPFDLDAVSFESGSLELEDGGFLNDFFSYDPKAGAGEQQASGKAGALRAAVAEEIKNSLASRPAFMRPVLSRFAVFLEKSGFLSLQASSSPPLLLRDVFNAPEELERLSIRTVHSQ